MPDSPPRSTDRRTGRISVDGASLRRHDGVRRTPEQMSSNNVLAGCLHLVGDHLPLNVSDDRSARVQPRWAPLSAICPRHHGRNRSA